VVRQSSFHCWCHSQRSVNPAEVVPRKVQRHCGLQVFEFLAESQTESRHAPEKRSHAKVATLHMRRADHLRVGFSSDDLWDRSNALRRGIPLPVSFIASINLDELREVDVRSEHILDRADVRNEAIRR